MFNLLKFVRFFVYAVFIVSQAITTSVAVWNMSIVQDSAAPSFVASQVDAYLIVIGSAGLLLIFPIIFADILEKSIFFCTVWFELLWVSFYGLLLLIGASLVTSLSTTQLCAPNQYVKSRLVASVILVAPCSSAQVLQVFTWIPAIFVATYATLLSILSFVRREEDPAIWSCLVRNFPLQKALHTIKRYSGLPGLPTASQKSLVIHAPKPRHIIPPLVFCRSARNSAYDPDQPSMSTTFGSAPAREANSSLPSVLRQSLSTTAFYHSSVQKAISSESGSRPPPPPARIRQGTAASPPPLGDWPRLDATSRPRTKRGGRTLPLELPALPPALPRAPPPPLSGISRVPTDALASRPLVPPGRTRLPGSGHGHRPPPLDLSKISTHQTHSRRHHAS